MVFAFLHSTSSAAGSSTSRAALSRPRQHLPRPTSASAISSTRVPTIFKTSPTGTATTTPWLPMLTTSVTSCAAAPWAAAAASSAALGHPCGALLVTLAPAPSLRASGGALPARLCRPLRYLWKAELLQRPQRFTTSVSP